MTVQEIFEEFCKLPKSEQDKVVAYLMGLRTSTNGQTASPAVSAKFKEIASKVFSTNEEMFKSSPIELHDNH